MRPAVCSLLEFYGCSGNGTRKSAKQVHHWSHIKSILFLCSTCFTFANAMTIPQGRVVWSLCPCFWCPLATMEFLMLEKGDVMPK